MKNTMFWIAGFIGQGGGLLSFLRSRSKTGDAAFAPRIQPNRYQTLAWLAVAFLGINTVLRLFLMAWDGSTANFGFPRLFGILGVGLLFDFWVVLWLLLPFGLLALACPDSPRGRKIFAGLALPLIFITLFGLVFTALSEIVFWNEFACRFNFIAVDYLLFSREVLGNIRESYPVPLLVSGVLLVAGLIFGTLWRRLKAAATSGAGNWLVRLATLAVLAASASVSLVFPSDELRAHLETSSARELADNGEYSFVRAFINNDLDYRAFYRTLDRPEALATLEKSAGNPATPMRFTGKGSLPTRDILAAGQPLPLNVVLVSIESLGSDYVEFFGGQKGLTPNLDRLAGEGIAFTRFYATGLRTVRGLEALTLSLPPTPGHAVPMRKNNTGLQTLGGVLRENGYDSLYLYGGYAYFDNMRGFFGGNGYTVIDRTEVPASQISHETIWGVADENIFRHSLQEIDSRVAAGKRVFAHIMTTSNHRPFTYPDGRIDIPSGHGREGAVKYTDWAIGELMREARKKPWFDDTLWVFVADHTSNGRGRVDLPPENYRIPAIFYAPKYLKPQKVDWVASQIDIAPTILGLLRLPFQSHFFGDDALRPDTHRQRALMGNYLTVGYMEDGQVVELKPKREVRVANAETGAEAPQKDPKVENLIKKAIAYYQVATELIHTEAGR